MVKGRQAPLRLSRIDVPPPRVENQKDHRTRDAVRAWAKAFDRAELDRLAMLYAQDAVLDQPSEPTVLGRDAIRRRLAKQLAHYANAGCNACCSPAEVFEDGNWGILEWQDPLGLRACSVFKFHDGRIVRQRDYWDAASHRRLYG